MLLISIPVNLFWYNQHGCGNVTSNTNGKSVNYMYAYHSTKILGRTLASYLISYVWTLHNLQLLQVDFGSYIFMIDL